MQLLTAAINYSEGVEYILIIAQHNEEHESTIVVLRIRCLRIVKHLAGVLHLKNTSSQVEPNWRHQLVKEDSCALLVPSQANIDFNPIISRLSVALSYGSIAHNMSLRTECY